jgi:hypothetical protein
MRTVRRVDLSAKTGGEPVRDDVAWGVDALTTEVMRDPWRHEALCAHIETLEKSSAATCELVCRQCPVAEPCFWAALIEERSFRTVADLPPGVRGGVSGAKRRFILRELTDAEIMVRYRREVAVHDQSKRTTVIDASPGVTGDPGSGSVSSSATSQAA